LKNLIVSNEEFCEDLTEQAKEANHLQDDSDAEDHSRAHDDQLPTEAFSGEEANDASEEGTALECRDNVGRQRGKFLWATTSETKSALETGEVDCAADEGGIVTVHRRGLETITLAIISEESG
jgi:hypothetical protein